MNKTSSCIGLVLVASLLVACGTSSSSVQTTAPTCNSPTNLSCRIAVDPPSVVRWVAPATDGVAGGASTAVVERTSDKTCMAGTVDPGASGAGWGAIMVFELAPQDGSTVVAPFDLQARGVTQVRFSLSNPPPTGVLLQLNELSSVDCKTAPGCLVQFSGPPALTTAGSFTVALGDFVSADAQHANKASDPTMVTGLQFYVSPVPGKAFDYNFCIQDLQFLDAAGNEVLR